MNEIKHCTFDDIFHDHGMKPEEKVAVITYLAPFAAPVWNTPDGNVPTTSKKSGAVLKCRCGELLDGFFGSFRWTLAHGEGECNACGTPARALHYLSVDGKETRIDFILQYHPDGVISEKAA